MQIGRLLGRLELSLTLKQNEVLPGAKVGMVFVSSTKLEVYIMYDVDCCGLSWSRRASSFTVSVLARIFLPFYELPSLFRSPLAGLSLASF